MLNSDQPSTLEEPPGELGHIIHAAIRQAGGWIAFDRFMALALYTPGNGYYASGSGKFGLFPEAAGTPGSVGDRGGQSASDFATAPEMTPLFGRALAAQVAEALQRTGTDEVWEFGGGSGALALHILQALDQRTVPWSRYTIVEVSASLRARQQALLAPYGSRVVWADALPEQMQGVVVGNEVLDAMPVKLLARAQGRWRERGVASHPKGGFEWQDRDSDLSPPLEPAGQHDYLTEIHPQAEAFVRTLADRLVAGAAFFIDYGFPEHEYYYPERRMGTLMCHRAHRADADPLQDVGQKDITAHVNFTGVALAAQDAGLAVLGYCSQARFLMNCGLLADLETASWADKAMAQKLLMEHEMGELFKVVGLCRGDAWLALGFAQGDRTHTL